MSANPDSFFGFSPGLNPETATEETCDAQRFAIDERTRHQIEQTIAISADHRTVDELMYLANGYENAAREKRSREIEGRF